MTDKTSVDDIIGIVKTEEPTNSVQLKKEAQLSICEKRVRELEKENEQLKQQLDDNLQFLIRASKRLGFESLDHLLYTLDKGEIYGYSTANWEKGDRE